MKAESIAFEHLLVKGYTHTKSEPDWSKIEWGMLTGDLGGKRLPSTKVEVPRNCFGRKVPGDLPGRHFGDLGLPGH